MEELLSPVQVEYQPIRSFKGIFRDNCLYDSSSYFSLSHHFYPQARISVNHLLLLMTYKFSCGETVGVAHKQLQNFIKKKKKITWHKCPEN